MTERTISRFRPFAIALACFLAAGPALAADLSAILPRDAIWKYLDTGVDQGEAWRAPGFDDSAWKSGRAPLGYGDDFSETDPSLPLATAVDFGKANDKHMTTYFRTAIQVDDPVVVKEIEVYIHVDDGAVVYVNGVELFRRGIKPGKVEFKTPAKFKPKEETFVLPGGFLLSGKNVIAVEVHQDGGDSSDLWFELGFKAPGAAARPVASPVTMPAASPVADAVAAGSITKLTVCMGPDAATSRGFAWYTGRGSIGSMVQLVEAGPAFASVEIASIDFASAKTWMGHSAESATSPLELLHKVEVIGLKPATLYAYRVGDAKAGVWSAPGSFSTSAKAGGFSFIDMADAQAKNEEEALLAARTLASALATLPTASFIAMNGDIVDTGMMEKQWNWLLDNAKDTLMATTFVPVAGNHEEDPASFINHFSLPVPFGAPVLTGAYYSFDQQNAHFIVLNNNEDSPEYADFSPTQIEWLKADVEKARKAGQQWMIVLMHKGPYTTSNHATDEDIMGPAGVRTLVAPLFAKLGVDLVLQGHDHIYARSWPIKEGKAVIPELRKGKLEGIDLKYMVKPRGTVYLIPSTCGPKVYYRNKKIDPDFFGLFAVADEHHAAVYGPDPADASRPLRGSVQDFVVFNVNGTKLTAISYEIDQKKNGGKPFVIDRFGIMK